MWAPGTIVVCVNDSPSADPRAGALAPEWVVRGSYYTVRDCFYHVDGYAVRLHEIRCLINPDWGVEQTWCASRFRLAESSHSEAGTVRQQEPVRA